MSQTQPQSNVLSQIDKQRMKKQFEQWHKSVGPPVTKKTNAKEVFQRIMAQARKNGYIKPKDLKVINSITGREKPSKEKIDAMYPGLKQIGYVNKGRSQNKSMKQIENMIQQAYQFGMSNGKNPKQVFQQLQNHDSRQYKYYEMLKQYTGSAAVRQKLKDAAYGKMRKKVSQDCGVPLHDADIIILLDDWYEDLKGFGNHVVSQAKSFIRQNKQQLYPMITGLLTRIHPALGALSGFAIERFGGSLESQDPYANDVQYMRYIFGQGPSHPAPRFESHYMYQMTTRIQVLIKTNSEGECTLVINPITMFQPSAFVANSATLPFASVCNATSPNLFAIPPVQTYSPFNSQKQSVMTYALDSLQIDFIQTQSPINIKGKYQTSFFYQPPNETWNRTAAGTYDTSTIHITDSQITNNTGYVLRRSCAQSTKLTRIGTYINQFNKNECLPVNTPTQISNDVVNNTSFVIVKFTGCSPSATIGTIWLTVAASIQPVASMRGILKVTPRGSYQGFFRATKQARKLGIPLQFLDLKSAQFLFKQNFAEIDFKSITRFGCGYDNVVDPLFRILFDPRANGFCMNQCLKYIGITPPKTPWMSIQQLQSYMVNYVVYSHGCPIQIVRRSQSDVFIRLNLDTRHASVVKLNRNVVTWNWMGVSNYTTQTYSVNTPGFYVNYKYGVGTNPTKHFMPEAISSLSYPNLRKLIQNNILVTQVANVQYADIQVDMLWVKQNPFNGPFGTVTSDGSNLIISNTHALTTLHKPYVWQAQRATGRLFDLEGRLLDPSTNIATTIILSDSDSTDCSLTQQQIQCIRRQCQTIRQLRKQSSDVNWRLKINSTKFSTSDSDQMSIDAYLMLVENNDPFVDIQEVKNSIVQFDHAQLQHFLGGLQLIIPSKLIDKVLMIGQQLWNTEQLSVIQAQHYILHQPRLSKSSQVRLIMNLNNIIEVKSKRWLTLAQIKTLLLMGCVQSNPGPIVMQDSESSDEQAL